MQQEHSLWHLRLKAHPFCCILLLTSSESPEDKEARQSALFLAAPPSLLRTTINNSNYNETAWKVIWHRRPLMDAASSAANSNANHGNGSDKSGGGGGAWGGFMSNMFSAAANTLAETSLASSVVKSVHAKLALVDAPQKQGPALLLVANDGTNTNDQANADDTDADLNSNNENNKSTQKLVSLHQISTIQPSSENAAGVVFHGKENKGQELLRMDLNVGGSMTNTQVETLREEFISNLQTLLEWDTRMRDGHDDPSTTTNSNSNKSQAQQATSSSCPQTGGLAGRAQKAAYFAKKELELQQRRREREQKKAKYLENAGGLKYTALAMANREDS